MKRTLRPTRRRLFRSLSSASPSAVRRKRSRLLFESLENRLLLAGDLQQDWLTAWDGSSAVPLAGGSAAETGGGLVGADLPQFGAQGEGEDAPDLVAFAKALADADVKFYGAGWCPFCNDQKALFEDGARFLPFIEVTNPDRTLNQTGIDENISIFPTWEFPGGSRQTGVLTLEELSTASGVAIPQGSAPSFAPLSNVTVLGGAPLHVALDGYDPNGTEITYTVTSSNPSLVTPELRDGRSLMLETSFGPIVIGTFEDQVPRVTEALFQLVEDDVWDNTIFHRVINNFVIQGGDPTGTGFGDSSLPRFDDQFHVDGQHTSSNLASIAKAGDDSASSQFFITEGPQRHLDFNHSVWGLVVEGAANREAISNVAVNGSDRPTVDVVLQDASVFEDTENAVLTLKAAEGESGTAMITVTATDSEGLQTSQTFQVTVTPDTVNGTPFLDDIPDITTTPGTPVTVQITAQDVEGDAIRFNAFSSPNLTFNLPGSPVTPVGQTATASLTITPNAGFVGTQTLTVFVHSPSTPVNPASVTANQIASFADVQTITIHVVEGAPTGVDLEAVSDTGVNDTDNVTRDNTPSVTISGVQSGAVVRLFDGATQVAQGTAVGTTISLTSSTLADGVHQLTATQEVGGVESPASPALQVTVDTQIAEISSTPGTSADLGVAYTYNVQHPEEGNSAFSYDLLEAPAGATINSATGLITWTPVASQLGEQSFVVSASDLAGNTREQSFSVTAEGDVIAQFHFELLDTSGNAITQVNVGDTFVLAVFTEDPRANPSGVFAGFLDVIFEQGLVEAVGDIQFGSQYTVARDGEIQTGRIDEVGGAAGSLTPLGGGRLLLFSVEMEAKIAGTERIFGDPADEPITHDVLVFGNDDPIPTALVDYGETTLTIGLGFGANGDIFSFDEDSVDNALDVLNNDESTGTLTIVSVTTPDQGGTVTINATNDGLIYTPAANFNGSEVFEYTVSDGANGGQSTATVRVDVHPVNDSPTATNDTANVARNSSDNFIDVLTNDLISPDVGETLRVTAVGQTSSGGTASIGPGGNHILYDAPNNFSGTDTFTYTISDGNGGTSTASVTVTVDEGNAPPVANNDTFSVEEDSVDNLLDVLANDTTGPDSGETLTILSFSGITDNGVVEIINGGTQLRYRPAANFSGFESFTYTLSDGNGGTDQALVTVNVGDVNDPPVASDDALVATKNLSGQSLFVLVNDTDPDVGDTLRIDTVSTGSQGGTLTVAEDGMSVIYTPATDFVGEETFTYTVVDGDGESSQATATVNVRDFVPGSLSGLAYLDVDNDGVRDADEMVLFNVTILLTGTDQDGNQVERTQQTAADGTYSFTDLVPGQYTLLSVQQPFVLDGIDSPGSLGGDASVNDQITVQLEDGEHGTGYNFGERGLAPQHIGLLNSLASSRKSTMLAAVSSDAESNWYMVDAAWSQANLRQVIPASTSSSPAAIIPRSLRVTTSDGNGGLRAATLVNHQPLAFHSLADAASYSLLRVVGPPSELSFVDIAPETDSSTDDSSGGGSGSGSGSGTDSGSGSGGEGEAQASRLAFSGEAGEGESSLLFVPLLDGDRDLSGDDTSLVEDGLPQPGADVVLVPEATSASSLAATSVDQALADTELLEATTLGDDPQADSDPTGDLLSLDTMFGELGSQV